jgi:DNA-binding CsgD family transcriptional regulator
VPEGLVDDEREQRRRSWLQDAATTLQAPHLAPVAMVAIVHGTGEIIGATDAASELLGTPLASSVDELVERGTVARHDLERLRERARRRHGPERPAPDQEHAETWSDELRIHRDGASTTVQLQVLHHRRPGLGTELVVVTLVPPVRDPAGGAPGGQPPHDLELWSIIDGQGRVLAMEAGWDVLWAQPDRILGTLVTPLCHPEDLPEVLRVARGLYVGTSEMATYTVRLAADGGRWVPVHVEQRAVRTASGDLMVMSTHRLVDGSRRLILPGQLSRRETEVVSALFDGGRVTHIAERHGVSVHTVRNQLRSVYRKLGADGQADLLARFHRPVVG